MGKLQKTMKHVVAKAKAKSSVGYVKKKHHKKKKVFRNTIQKTLQKKKGAAHKGAGPSKHRHKLDANGDGVVSPKEAKHKDHSNAWSWVPPPIPPNSTHYVKNQTHGDPNLRHGKISKRLVKKRVKKLKKFIKKTNKVAKVGRIKEKIKRHKNKGGLTKKEKKAEHQKKKKKYEHAEMVKYE